MFAIDLNRLLVDEQAEVYSKMVPAPSWQGIEIGLMGIPVRADRVTAPMPVVGGNDDQLTPPSLARRIAAKYGADLRLYDNHVYYLIREPGWESIASAILAWLADKVSNP